MRKKFQCVLDVGFMHKLQNNSLESLNPTMEAADSDQPRVSSDRDRDMVVVMTNKIM